MWRSGSSSAPTHVRAALLQSAMSLSLGENFDRAQHRARTFSAALGHSSRAGRAEGRCG
jgi:hypothetical protein